jgi:nucleotide-binding universal stress UspA family protein
MATSSWSSPVRQVQPIDGGWRPWRRGWIRSTLETRETVLVTRRTSTASVLCVDDGSLLLRHWLRRLIGADTVRRVRCLGVLDTSAPWYAGIGFSPAELIEAIERTDAEQSRTLDRSTRALALWLERRRVPAVAECQSGKLADTVLTRARETNADLILIRDDGRRRSAIRTIVERADCSVLVVRTGQPSGRPAAGRRPSLGHG